MNICEATKKALATGGYITNKNWACMRIKPTDTPDCCVVRRTDIEEEKAPGKRWHPQAKNLISEDWEVITE